MKYEYKFQLTWHITKLGYQLGCQKVGSFNKDENAVSVCQNSCKRL